MKKNQQGFSVVEIILVILVVGLIATVGWLVWDRANTKSDSSKPATVLNDKETAGTGEKTTQEAKADETSKVDPNAGYLVVSEWGLRFKVPSGLSDVEYAIRDDVLAFYGKPTGSTLQYRSDYKIFDGDHPSYSVGVVYRSTSSTKDRPDRTVEGRKIGSYYYYTAWSFNALATGVACQQLFGDSGEESCKAHNQAFGLVNNSSTGLIASIELAQ